jgi:hypothetical protein
MSLSPDRKAIADRAIQQTFERASVAWQALAHWDTRDPAATVIRNDVVFTFATADARHPTRPLTGPFGIAHLEPETKQVKFTMTLAQATALTPDALLASVIPRTVTLAQDFDDAVLQNILEPYKAAVLKLANKKDADWYNPLLEALAQNVQPPNDPGSTPGRILSQLIRGRQLLEDSGYRAPCCLISSTGHFKDLHQWVDGDVAAHKLLAGVNANSLHRNTKLDVATVAGAQMNVSLMIGRRQEFPGGCASGVSPGEEPVDLAISVPPSLEVIGENAQGNVELAIRIRFATRVKDQRGIVVFHT